MEMLYLENLDKSYMKDSNNDPDVVKHWDKEHLKQLESTQKTTPQQNLQPTSLEIKNLLVSPLPIRELIIGEVQNIVDITHQKQNEIDCAIWNEKGIAIIFKQDNTELIFAPEFHPSSEMFFQRREKYGRNRDGDMIRVWDGDYDPIQFAKGDLIKFLNRYSEYFDPIIEKSIKNLRVTHKKTEESEMLDLDEQSHRTVTEVENTTNIPRQFEVSLPLFGNYNVMLNFEACVTKKVDQYGSVKNQNVIEINVTNGREAVRDVMLDILKKFPESIPKYYGKTKLLTKEK